MPALHIHDVARIAYRFFVSEGDASEPAGWAHVEQATRDAWASATQNVIDDVPPIQIENWIGPETADTHEEFIALVNACRPYVEEP